MIFLLRRCFTTRICSAWNNFKSFVFCWVSPNMEEKRIAKYVVSRKFSAHKLIRETSTPLYPSLFDPNARNPASAQRIQRILYWERVHMTRPNRSGAAGISYFINIGRVSPKSGFCFLAFSRKFLYKVAGQQQGRGSAPFRRALFGFCRGGRSLGQDILKDHRQYDKWQIKKWGRRRKSGRKEVDG